MDSLAHQDERDRSDVVSVPPSPLPLLYNAYTTTCNPIHSVMESAVINLDIA